MEINCEKLLSGPQPAVITMDWIYGPYRDEFDRIEYTIYLQIHVQCIRTAIAVECYYLKNKKYPESIEEAGGPFSTAQSNINSIRKAGDTGFSRETTKAIGTPKSCWNFHGRQIPTSVLSDKSVEEIVSDFFSNHRREEEVKRASRLTSNVELGKNSHDL